MFSELLISGTDLEVWSDTIESQSRLPEIIRKLILSNSADINHLNFPAHEGVQLGGWDGVVFSKFENTYVPEGLSVWEAGTSKDVKKKAERDYTKRLNNLTDLDPAKTTYIFVSSRRWSKKEDWVKEKMKDNVWKNVLVYDADDLETWLSMCPVVHIWASMLLKKYPEGSLDLENYWLDWSEETRPHMSSDMVLAGRPHIVKDVQKWLYEKTSSLTLKAKTIDEAIAVFAASLLQFNQTEKEFFFSKAVVINDLKAWNHISGAQTNLILIPTFEISASSRAIRNEHQLFLPSSDATHRDGLEVPNVSRHEFAKLLSAQDFPEQEIERLSHLARKSLMLFRRDRAQVSGITEPSWVKKPSASSLVPLLLIGKWDESFQGDQKVIEKITKKPYEQIENELREWLTNADTPIHRTGNILSLVSKEESFSFLSRYLTRREFNDFKEIVLEVLTIKDAKYQLPVDQQWASTILLDEELKYSSELIRSIVDTLAFISASEYRYDNIPDLILSDEVQNLVRNLFKQINDIDVWLTLSPYLPRIAEAAPEEFLKKMESEIKNQIFVRGIFQDEHNAIGNSAHTGVLWALETLAWKPDYLMRVAFILGRLSNEDPGGKLGNRPKNSLHGIFFLPFPQTFSSSKIRLHVMEKLSQREPEAAWTLFYDLLSIYHSSIIGHPKPKWQDWDTAISSYQKSIRELQEEVQAIVKLVTKLANESGERWGKLVTILSKVTPEDTELILSGLNKLAEKDISIDDREILWNALRNKLSRHNSFPDAEWALSNELISQISEIYRKLEPQELLPRFRWVFSNHPKLPEGRQEDYIQYQTLWAEYQNKALIEIIKIADYNTFNEFIENIDKPYVFGWSLSAMDLSKSAIDETAFLRSDLKNDSDVTVK